MKDVLAVIEAIARDAGAVLLDGFGHVTDVEHKGVTDLVTEWDRRSEALILAALGAHFPEYPVLAEESGESGHGALAGGHRWLVDPLDGTTNFAHGYPFFAVSIALARDDRPIAGVVYDPVRDEMFAAQAGKGATLNGEPIWVSAETHLQEALLATGFPYNIATAPHKNFDEFTRFHLQVQGIRRDGSAALDAAWVGAGRVDGYWEFGIKAWDIAAGALVAQEAGGRATTVEGAEVFVGAGSIVVSNGRLHDRMLAILRESTER